MFDKIMKYDTFVQTNYDFHGSVTWAVEIGDTLEF